MLSAMKVMIGSRGTDIVIVLLPSNAFKISAASTVTAVLGLFKIYDVFKVVPFGRITLSITALLMLLLEFNKGIVIFPSTFYRVL